MPRSGEASSEPNSDLVVAFERSAERLARARAQLIEVSFGREGLAELALAAAVAGGWAMMVGPPGGGKTALAENLASTLGLTLGRHTFTPDSEIATLFDTSQSRRLGTVGSPHRGLSGPMLRQMFLAEDLDRARPRVRAAVLEAAHEGVIEHEGARISLPRPFHLLASSTQEGVVSFDETEADRFLMHIPLPAPDREVERRLLVETASGSRSAVSAVMRPDELVEAQRVAVELPVGEKVVEVILDTVRRARPEDPSAPSSVRDLVARGPGPRAGQALMRLSRALALIDGRPSPSVADVRRLIAPVIQHRLVMTRAAAGRSAEALRALIETQT